MDSLLPSKPSTLIWLFFTVVASCLTVVGVSISRTVILGQEKQLMLQGEDHDRRIARNMERYLRARIEREMTPPEVVKAFQNLLLGLTDLSSYAIFLVDRRTGNLIAHSALPMVGLPVSEALRRVETLKAGTPGEALFVARTGEDKLALVYTTQIPDIHQPGRMQWTLGVAADLSELTRAIATLQDKVTVVLVVTALAITLTALLSMVGLYRRFGAIDRQRMLEHDTAARSEQAQAAHKATLAAIGQTASMLAHEIRNPLAAMRLGLSDVLSRADNLNERDRKRLSLSIKEVERLDTLLSDTLDYVRPAKLSTHPVPLDELIDTALEGQEPLLARLGQRVVRVKCPGCPPTRCDAVQLGQVLLNLLHNAVAACPEQGGIEISLTHADGALVLQVDNDSSPLPLATLEHAFDTFFTTKQRGTGLGLAVARRIIEAHHGKIDMENLPSGRVRVKISLPVLSA
ncbi:MAG: GHKL domain-containing protein [Gammaproteobacteria bacterium]|nr:GHKL domain-containing protein [Gammaproteobacteria bacterium]